MNSKYSIGAPVESVFWFSRMGTFCYQFILPASKKRFNLMNQRLIFWSIVIGWIPGYYYQSTETGNLDGSDDVVVRVEIRIKISTCKEQDPPASFKYLGLKNFEIFYFKLFKMNYQWYFWDGRSILVSIKGISPKFDLTRLCHLETQKLVSWLPQTLSNRPKKLPEHTLNTLKHAAMVPNGYWGMIWLWIWKHQLE